MLLNFSWCLISLALVVSVTPSYLNVAVHSNEKFASNLFKNTGNDTDNNLIISPLSAQLITEFLRLGSGGNTAVQITNALYLRDSRPRNGFKLLLEELQKNLDTTIKIANRVYVSEKNSLNNNFERDARESLMIDAVNVDFSKEKTTDDINNWVEQRTENKIKDLVPPSSLTRETSLLLVNTLYFKGLWDSPFDREYSRQFFQSNNERIETTFLFMKTVSGDDVRTAELPELYARILDIPYKGRQVRFLLILPNSYTTQSLEERMTNIDLDDLLSKTESTPRLEISIPKFKIESSIDLKQVFPKMGMTDMFTENVADFSKMTNSNDPPLYVTKAIQKTFIDINIAGTEAAAATYIKVGNRLEGRRPPVPFIANHPFLFYVIHKTTSNHSTVLFSGRFTTPSPI